MLHRRGGIPFLLSTCISLSVTLLLACGGDDEASSQAPGPTSSQGSSSTSGGSGPSGGGGAGGPLEPGGSFIIVEGAAAQAFNYTLAAGELIFCRYYAELGDYLWVRLGESPEEDGDSGPHLDIDVCAFDGSGDYPVMDPAGGGCMGRPGWDVWWHEQQFVSYVNEPDSDPCTLTLNQSGDVLYGTFECAPLSMGPDDIEVRNGSFSCEIEAQD